MSGTFKENNLLPKVAPSEMVKISWQFIFLGGVPKHLMRQSDEAKEATKIEQIVKI